MPQFTTTFFVIIYWQNIAVFCVCLTDNLKQKLKTIFFMPQAEKILVVGILDFFCLDNDN